jgi:hypothetical protein
MNSAKNTAPTIVAGPPATTAAREEIESVSVSVSLNDSGDTNQTVKTYIAPPMPASAALNASVGPPWAGERREPAEASGARKRDRCALRSADEHDAAADR